MMWPRYVHRTVSGVCNEPPQCAPPLVVSLDYHTSHWLSANYWQGHTKRSPLYFSLWSLRHNFHISISLFFFPNPTHMHTRMRAHTYRVLECPVWQWRRGGGPAKPDMARNGSLPRPRHTRIWPLLLGNGRRESRLALHVVNKLTASTNKHTHTLNN